MAPLATITPSQVLRLWHRQPRSSEQNRLIAFSIDLARTLQEGRFPHQERVLLNELNLPTMAYNALRRAGYVYIDEVQGLSARELMLINHVGSNSAQLIIQAVQAWRRGRAKRSRAAAADDQPLELGEEQLEGLQKAFYACSEDHERMAALLLYAADLMGGGGPEDLRSMAMRLLDAARGHQGPAAAVQPARP